MNIFMLNIVLLLTTLPLCAMDSHNQGDARRSYELFNQGDNPYGMPNEIVYRDMHYDNDSLNRHPHNQQFPAPTMYSSSSAMPYPQRAHSPQAYPFQQRLQQLQQQHQGYGNADASSSGYESDKSEDNEELGADTFKVYQRDGTVHHLKIAAKAGHPQALIAQAEELLGSHYVSTKNRAKIKRYSLRALEKVAKDSDEHDDCIEILAKNLPHNPSNILDYPLEAIDKALAQAAITRPQRMPQPMYGQMHPQPKSSGSNLIADIFDVIMNNPESTLSEEHTTKLLAIKDLLAKHIPDPEFTFAAALEYERAAINAEKEKQTQLLHGQYTNLMRTIALANPQMPNMAVQHAYIILATMYKKGNFVQPNAEQVTNLLSAALQAGNKSVRGELADRLLNGIGTAATPALAANTPRPEAAFEIASIAAADDDIDAIEVLAKMYQRGTFVQENENEAQRLRDRIPAIKRKQERQKAREEKRMQSISKTVEEVE